MRWLDGTTYSKDMGLCELRELVMYRVAWSAVIHGVTKSWIWLSNFHSLAPGKKSYNKPRQHIKKQRQYFANKGPSSQGYGSSSHVWM